MSVNIDDSHVRNGGRQTFDGVSYSVSAYHVAETLFNTIHTLLTFDVFVATNVKRLSGACHLYVCSIFLSTVSHQINYV